MTDTPSDKLQTIFASLGLVAFLATLLWSNSCIHSCSVDPEVNRANRTYDLQREKERAKAHTECMRACFQAQRQECKAACE